MKYIIIFTLFLTSALLSQNLRVKANAFNSDAKNGISLFKGDVKVMRGSDELNASSVEIYTNKNNKPIKFVASGDVSFKIKTKKGAMYEGKAQKVIYLPLKKQYHFLKDVHLKQLDDKKEIIGNEVFLNTLEGKAYAKGADNKPIIMIFNISDNKENK